jgi:hypothetical protein
MILNGEKHKFGNRWWWIISEYVPGNYLKRTEENHDTFLSG